MKKKQKIIVTGGAGFIGTNTAAHFLQKGYEVVVIDNLSRKGTAHNLEWLQKQWDFPFYKVDIRNFDELKDIFKKHSDAAAVVHLAGQVAVTTSIDDPRTDFEVNLFGTFNVLEALRANTMKPLVIFSSTNKVYGGLESQKVVEKEDKYEFADLPHGVHEEMLLDFHSPYGVSKGGADQYVRDYARIYDIPTVVMRQSCIYGRHQFGIEDQGWVAWFLIAAAILQKPMKIYGNGKQVRDVLHVDDLIELYELAIKNVETVRGQIFNVGGGPENSLSIWREFSVILNDLGLHPKTSYGEWRQGDQPIYISDIRKAKKLLGWEPKIKAQQGIKDLYNWIMENEALIRPLFK